MIGTTQAPPPDSLRSVLRDVFAGSEYDWDREPRTISLLRGMLHDVIAWADSLHQTHPVAYWTVLGGLTAIAVLLLAHIGALIWRALQPPPRSQAVPAAAPARVRDHDWHVSEMRRLRGEGRYLEALGHRFTALLLELDRRKAVRYDPSKTPAEYAREARLESETRSSLGELVDVLYGHLFAGLPCTDEDVERFDRRASELGGAVAAN